jgi:hypothetical protein
MKLVALILIITAAAVTVPAGPSPQALTPVGRWQIKFTLLDSPEKNLVFTAEDRGDGSFQFLDTGPENKPVQGLKAAAWSLTNGHLSISGEGELPIGTCCRETGTLIFKAKFQGSNSLSGKLIFVTNIDEDESAYKFHSTIGTFSATRLPD